MKQKTKETIKNQSTLHYTNINSNNVAGRALCCYAGFNIKEIYFKNRTIEFCTILNVNYSTSP